MPHVFSISCCLLFVSCLCAVRVRAQFGETAEIDAELAATNALDPTAAGTTVSTANRVEANPTIKDVLVEVPGARPLTTGDDGAFSGVALRGATFEQTEVLLGDLPLGSRDLGPFDLNLIPVSMIERVEVYRGGAPVHLATNPIGGVVRIMPKRANGNRSLALNANAGSFRTWSTDGQLAFATNRSDVFASVGFFDTAGDFPFLNDNNTRFDTQDDFEDRRRNNHSQRIHGLLYSTHETSVGMFETLLFAVARQAGVPGLASNQAARSAEDRARFFGAAGWTESYGLGARERTLKLNVTGAGSYERLQFTDRFNEIGQQQQATDDRIPSAQLRASLQVEATDWLELTLVGRVQYESYQPEDAFRSVGQLPSRRVSTFNNLEARLHGRLRRWLWEFRPSVQWLWSRGRIEDLAPLSTGFVSRTELEPTYRVGWGLGPSPWFSIVGAVYRGVRLPSIFELFGDAARQLANPELVAERSDGADVGIVLAGERNEVSGSFELRAFANRFDDFIQTRAISTGTAIAENISRARVFGVEVGGRGELGKHVLVVGSLNWKKTQESFDNELPLRARLNAFARLGLRSGRWDSLEDALVYVDVTHVGSNFLDPANFVTEPARTWVGVGVRIASLGDVWILDFSMRDLLDRGGSDLLGLPLPGRRVALSVGYRKDLKR